MGLEESLEEAIKSAPANSVCSVAKAKETISKEDYEILKNALYNRSIKASVLARALRKENIDVSETTITRHRNGWCKTCGS